MKKSIVLPALATTLILAVGCEKANTPAKDSASTKSPATAEKAAAKSVPVPAVTKAPEKPADPNEVVASVNGVKYLRKEMDEMVSALLKAQKIPAEQMQEAKRYFEQRTAYSFVMKTLLLSEAKKANMVVTEADRTNQLAKIAAQLKSQNKTVEQLFKESPLGEKAARKEFEDGLLIDKLIKTAVLDKLQVKKEDVAKAIADIKAANVKIEAENKTLDAEKAKAKNKAEALKKQLDAGADFAKLAKENSDCPSKEKGGDLGEFTKGQMVKPFEDAAFSQELGKVGKIVETQFGYHIIKVTSRNAEIAAKDGKPAKPASVKASHILIKTPQAKQVRPIPSEKEMTEQLKNPQGAVQKYIEGLKKTAKIETIFKDLGL